ncbi:hypothetical protein C8F01DRAFT_1233068 [Mycena amicta]|nr:hypothetical protein C8F01DRAFT_1233068 [Mycena amicta]
MPQNAYKGGLGRHSNSGLESDPELPEWRLTLLPFSLLEKVLNEEQIAAEFGLISIRCACNEEQHPNLKLGFILQNGLVGLRDRQHWRWRWRPHHAGSSIISNSDSISNRITATDGRVHELESRKEKVPLVRASLHGHRQSRELKKGLPRGSGPRASLQRRSVKPVTFVVSARGPIQISLSVPIYKACARLHWVWYECVSKGQGEL